MLGAREPIAALNRVRIVETGEALVDIRAHCPAVEVMEQCCPYLRRTVAEMLSAAQAALPVGHHFRVGTALRTLSMQKGGWDSYYRRMQDEHPNWPLSALRRATNRFFAPYDQPAPPGHCTGGAVDVAIIGPDGSPLDVTSPLSGWEAAYTWSERITPEARANRMVLVEAMLGAGFSNCREEFWHYSWGDSAWAVRVGERECPYGLVEPPVAVEARFPGARCRATEAVGPGEWSVMPEPIVPGEPALLVGVFWSEGKPALLRIGPPSPGALFTSPDKKTWAPVHFDVEDGAVPPNSPPSQGVAGGGAPPPGSSAVLRLVPDTPRVYVSDAVPKAP